MLFRSALPRVLIAHSHGTLLGSVNLLTNEMPIRPQFTPWVGQLFIAESQRSRGVGAALLDAAARYVERLEPVAIKMDRIRNDGGS